MKKKTKSPMVEVFDELDAGINSANGILARLWRRILSQRNIRGHQWERLLDRWRLSSIAVYGREAVNVKKNNLAKALASPNITWKTFIQGLQVLNAAGKYQCIRFEIHLISHRGPTEVIGIDVVDRSKGSQPVSDINVTVLNPGDTVEHGRYYTPANFTNGAINNSVIKYRGTEPLVTHPDMFNGYTTIGSMVLMADGMESPDWLMQKPPSMLHGEDDSVHVQRSKIT